MRKTAARQRRKPSPLLSSQPSPPTPLLTADLLAARHGAPSIACGAPWLADALTGPPLPPPPHGGARARASLLRSLERAAATTAAHAVAAGPPPPKSPAHPRRRPAAVRWRDQRPLDVSAVEAEAALKAALADTESNDEAAESTTRRDGGRVLAKLVVDAWRGSGGGGGGALALTLRPLRAAAADGGRARAFDAMLALALHADLVDAPRSGDEGGSGGSDARPLAHHPASPPATAFLEWVTHLLAALLDDAAAAANVTDADWRAAADALAAVATRGGGGGLTARAAAVVPPRAAVALAAAATEGGWPAHVGLHLARLAVAAVYESEDGGCVDARSQIDPARLTAAGGLPAYASLLAATGACPPETRRNIACVLLDGLAAGAEGDAAADAARALLADRPAAAADALAASVAGGECAEDTADCTSDAPPLATILAALGVGLPPALVPAVAHLLARAAPRRSKTSPLSPPATAAVDLLTCDDDRAGDAGRALLAAVLARAPRDSDTLLPPPPRAVGDPPACAIGALLAAVLASPSQHAATRVVAAVRGALLAWAGVSERSETNDRAPPPRLATALATVASLTAWLATAPPNARPRACADAVDLLLECVARPHPPPATLAGGGAVDGLAATAAVTRPTPAFLAGATALPDTVAAVLPVNGLRAVLAALPASGGGGTCTPHAARAADARLAALLLLLTATRIDDAILAAAGGMAAILAAAGDDPRARSAAAATALTRLDARRGGELAAALARAGEEAAARGEGGAAPAPAPLLEAAVATGRVAVE